MKKWCYLCAIICVFVFCQCDWVTNPYILGQGEVELSSNPNEYICFINDSKIKVDSILSNTPQKRVFIPPYQGAKVTYFKLGLKNYFFEGKATSKEIKDAFFFNDKNKGDFTIDTFFITLIILLVDYTNLPQKPDSLKVNSTF